jgi:uncharacterized membrane protein YkvA (DUF1232 family)
MFLPLLLGGLVGFVAAQSMAPTETELVKGFLGEKVKDEDIEKIKYVVENFWDQIQNFISLMAAPSVAKEAAGGCYGLAAWQTLGMSESVIPESGYERQSRERRSIRRTLGEVPGVFEMIAMYYLLADPQTPLYLKAELASVLAYVLSPVDLIPDEIPGIGQLDDLGLLYLGYQHAKEHFQPHHLDQAEQWIRDRGNEPYLMTPKILSSWLRAKAPAAFASRPTSHEGFGASDPWEICPVCGMPAEGRCKCAWGDRECSCGHHWGWCPVHGRRVLYPPGKNLHALPTPEFGTCLCSYGKPVPESHPPTHEGFGAQDRRREEELVQLFLDELYP